MEKENETEKEVQKENINPNYLTNEQIQLYLEACLDHKITDFTVDAETDRETKRSMENFYTNPEEFKRLVKSKCYPEQDNLFYRAWVYQYDGLKELLSKDTKLNIKDGGNSFGGKNFNESNNGKNGKNGKNTDKEKKNVSFRFTFGSIDIKDLQKEKLYYKQFMQNPNFNFDEYKPKEDEIKAQISELNIIFLYVNLGVPLLEDDDELGENNKQFSGQHKYKYEYDKDRIIYYRKISFSLDKNDPSSKCLCHYAQAPNYYWVFEDRINSIPKKFACSQCLKDYIDKKEYKLIDNTKYSIRYYLYCNIKGHYTKKYEYYCNNCKRPYCIKCLYNEHKELFYINKVKEINQKKNKNDKIWEEINNAGDNAEKSLRERESKAIVDVKNEVLARCTFLTSLGYELHRMISELDSKTKYIEDLRKDSNVATYLNMNNMFLDDLKNHYIPNLEKIESLPLESFLETFHKIDKKYPENKKRTKEKNDDGEEEEEDEENEDNEFQDNYDRDEDD